MTSWTVEEYEAVEGLRYTIHDSEGEHITTLFPFPHNVEREYAHLISAAPEMLAVLQELVDSVAPGQRTAPILKKAYEAIAKAKGLNV